MNSSQDSFIPQASPKAGYLAHREEIVKAIHDVLDSGWYILGEEVKSFEQEFASYVGTNQCIGVASGTDAVELALRACGIGPNDVVFTVSLTAVATVSAIERSGALPFLVDIDPATLTMDSQSLEKAIATVKNSPPALNARPSAIIPVHLYGHPADMQSILEVARRHGLVVIEDCAQAHGAKFQGRMVGTWGDLGAYSFYPTKNLGAFGDGGAVVTNNKKYFERLCALREYGWIERHVSTCPGINSRLDELQAAILRLRLRYLEKDIQRRIHIAHIYRQGLEKTSFQLPRVIGENTRHAYHLYVIRTRERDRVKLFLKENSVGAAIHYPVPIHQQPAYNKRIPISPEGLPHTTIACQEILSLPIYPELPDEQIDRVCEVLKSCAAIMDKN